MGLFEILFGKKKEREGSRMLEDRNGNTKPKKKIAPLDVLLETGQYSKKNEAIKSMSDWEEQERGKKGIAPLDALFKTGQYRQEKSDSEGGNLEKASQEILKKRLAKLKLKKYRRDMEPRFNEDKNRIEVGNDFDLSDLPEIVYNFAQRKNVFRKLIGGRFDLRDRERLRYYLKKHPHKLTRARRRLNRPDEKRCKIALAELFE